MSLNRIVAAIMMISALMACSTDAVKKPDRHLMLSDETLVKVLTDTYLAEGLLDVPEIRKTWGKRDSLENFNDIFNSHGCTKEQFDATMYYYFASKPKKMAKVYDRVIENLKSLEAGVRLTDQPAPETPNEPANLWSGKTSYILPDDFTKDPLWFDIPVNTPGMYVLRADIQVYADDKSIDPRVTVFFSYKDKEGKEITDYWDEVKLTKDGKVQKVIIKKKLETAGDVHIKGWLLNHSPQSGLWEKHARLRNINLRLEEEKAVQE